MDIALPQKNRWRRKFSPQIDDINDTIPRSVQLVARNGNTLMGWIGRLVACNLLHEMEIRT